jgi:phosphoribosyl 1,2-cyclic phosphodiesterase
MDERAEVCVLASGSSGNCAVVRYRAGGRCRTVLVDAGLSPRRTRLALASVGLGLRDVDAVVLTHLDSDHWHAGWRAGWRRWMRDDARLHMHRSHAPRAARSNAAPTTPTPFDDVLELPGGAGAACELLAHDDQGVASFRFELGGASLGWITDAGHVTDALVARLRAVHVLGIESNYCPRRQVASGRPDFLVRRVMGDAGHLSNEQCLDAVERIAPSEHVVLLHLSRDCNHPDDVAAMHAGADYAITIADRHEPTRWVAIGPPAPVVRTRPGVGMGLWS